jgi:hypothetical protein
MFLLVVFTIGDNGTMKMVPRKNLSSERSFIPSSWERFQLWYWAATIEVTIARLETPSP